MFSLSKVPRFSIGGQQTPGPGHYNSEIRQKTTKRSKILTGGDRFEAEKRCSVPLDQENIPSCLQGNDKQRSLVRNLECLKAKISSSKLSHKKELKRLKHKAFKRVNALQGTIRELEAQLLSRDKILADAQERLQKLQSNLLAVEVALQRKEKKESELCAQLNRLNLAYTALSKEKLSTEALLRERGDLQSEECRVKLSRLSFVLHEREQEHIQISAKVVDLQKQISVSRQALQESQEVGSALRQAVAEMESENGGIRNLLEESRRRLCQKEEDIKTLEQALEKAMLDGTHAKTAAEGEALDLLIVCRQLDEAMSRIQALTEENQLLQHVSTEHAERVDQVASEKAQLWSALERQKAEVEVLCGKLEVSAAENQDLWEQIESSASDKKELEVQLESVIDQFNGVFSEKRELEVQLESLSAQNRELREGSASDTRKLESLSAQNGELREGSASDKRELESLRAQNRELKEGSARELESLSAQNRELRESSASDKRELESLSTQNRELREGSARELESLSAQNRELREGSASDKRELESLSAQNRELREGSARELESLSAQNRELREGSARELESLREGSARELESLSAQNRELREGSASEIRQIQLASRRHAEQLSKRIVALQAKVEDAEQQKASFQVSAIDVSRGEEKLKILRNSLKEANSRAIFAQTAFDEHKKQSLLDFGELDVAQMELRAKLKSSDGKNKVLLKRLDEMQKQHEKQLESVKSKLRISLATSAGKQQARAAAPVAKSLDRPKGVTGIRYLERLKEENALLRQQLQKVVKSSSPEA